MVPGQLLRLGLANAQHQVLRGHDSGIGAQGFAKASGGAVFDEQNLEDGLRIALAEGLFQLAAFGDIRRLAGSAQNARRLAQHRHRSFSPQKFQRLCHRPQVWKLRMTVRHRFCNHALGIGQRKLHPLVQCGL